jgi:hypothetical protein
VHGEDRAPKAHREAEDLAVENARERIHQVSPNRYLIMMPVLHMPDLESRFIAVEFTVCVWPAV